MTLIDLRAFARIAELSSISAAARTLSLPKSSISRSLTRLEADVSAPSSSTARRATSG